MQHFINNSLTFFGVILTFLVTINYSVGQTPYQGQQSFAQVGLRMNSYVDPISDQIKSNSIKVVGSPYEREEFETGWINMKDRNDTLSNFELKYNIADNRLLWKNDNKQLFMLGISNIASFGIGNEVFINKSSIGLPEEAFTRCIYNGSQCAIYLDTNVTSKVIEPEPYGATIKTIKYINSTTTIIKINDELTAIQTKKDLKPILNLYSISEKGISNKDLSDLQFLKDLGKKIDGFN